MGIKEFWEVANQRKPTMHVILGHAVVLPFICSTSECFLPWNAWLYLSVKLGTTTVLGAGLKNRCLAKTPQLMFPCPSRDNSMELQHVLSRPDPCSKGFSHRVANHANIHKEICLQEFCLGSLPEPLLNIQELFQRNATNKRKYFLGSCRCCLCTCGVSRGPSDSPCALPHPTDT